MREVQEYQRLPSHERLPRMIQYSDDKLDGYIILEYMRNGDVQSHLASDIAIEYTQQLQWCRQLQWCIQAAEGIALLHSFRLIHADIKPENMLLDDSMFLRMMDLSGSSIDGLPPLCLESTRFFLPRPMDADMPCSITTDLFALGSSIYQIMQPRQPYADLDDEQVTQNYQNQNFPDVAGLPCGGVILQCWTGQSTSAAAVVHSLKSKLPQQDTSIWQFFRNSLSCILSKTQCWFTKELHITVSIILGICKGSV